MPTVTLNIDLPSEEIEFLQQYAQQHGLSVAEVIAQYLQRLKYGAQPTIHPEVAAITGLVPRNINTDNEYHQHQLDKHR